MIKPVFKLILIFIWGLIWFFPVWIAKLWGKTAQRDRFMRICSQGLLRIMEIRLKVHGKLSKARPLLVVSNHLSYVDIPMLTSHAALRFTPKSEIAGWPLIGLICKITDCVFVERKPGKVKTAGQKLHETLAKGEVISLFPESTTGNGIHVLPFKSGFFSLAEEEFDGKMLTVQPVAMTYTRVRKLPVDSTMWHHIAWYGDMDLVPHLLDFLKLGPMDAELHYLEPVTIKQFADRKALALHCQQVITQAIETIREKRNAPVRQTTWTLSVLSWLKSKP